jgi:hypothetical protein
MTIEAQTYDQFTKPEDEPDKPNASAAPEPEWPVLDQAALYGLPGAIVEAIRPSTEADPVAVLAHVLTFYGNAIGRGAHYQVESVWHTSNLYVALVGVTSRSRKGTAAARAMQPFEHADPDWHGSRVVSGLSSGEGLIWAVRDPIEQEVVDKKTKTTSIVVSDHGEADKRMCVLEPEFGRVLAVMKRQGNTLSPVLRQAWETGRLMSLTKNNTAKATDALISIIAHITADELLRHLDNTEIANGLDNRFIFLAVRRSQLLPFGGVEVDMAALSNELIEALAYGGQAKRVRMDDSAARDMWAEAYPSLTNDAPGLAGALTARAAPQVMRLALINALMDRSDKIREQHLKAALALWRYSEASVLQVFGDTLGDPIADAILAALRVRKPDGMSRNDIRELFSRNVESARIGAALDALRKGGKAEQHTVYAARGRPTEMWFAT